MTNHSELTLNLTQLEDKAVDFEVLKTSWLIGIAVSAICLTIQLFILLLIPNSRKYDEKVLSQMTAARFLNTLCEFLICNGKFASGIWSEVVYALYFHSDFALICWMFVFTKNLYDKVVLVFVFEKLSMLVVSCLVWTLTAPIGILCPVLLTLSEGSFFQLYYKVYSHVKFFILLLNALVFFEIFHVAIRIGVDKSKNIRHLVKTAIIAFILICITSLQVLVSDLLSYFKNDDQKMFVIFVFCVINSFQAIAITIIFIILARKKVSDSMLMVISVKLKKLIS